MAGPQGRKRQRNQNRSTLRSEHFQGQLLIHSLSIAISRAARTRRRHLDGDQIQTTLRDPSKLDKAINPQEIDLDQKGLGLFYCVHCDRHFPSELHRATHHKSKLHKRKAKKLETEEAYTLEEANRAAGMGTDNSQRTSAGFTLAGAMAKAKGKTGPDSEMQA